MSTRKVIFIVIGIALLAGTIYSIIKFQRSGQGVADKVIPQLKLTQMQLTNLTAERADMHMSMVIDNPAPVGLNIDSLCYTIFIEDNEVVKTTYPDPLQIKASDSTIVSLPLTIYYDKLQSLLKKLEEEGKDSVLYKVNATIFTDIAVIPKDKFNLEFEEKLPLIRAFDIKVADLSVENLKFSGAVLKVEIYVINENVFPVGFDSIHYSLQIEDNETIEGHKPELVKIQAKDTATITIPMEINFKEMGKGMVDLIREGSDLSYDFSLRTKMISDVHMLKESEMTLNATGKLKDLAEVAKEQISEE